jgi:hypothetical protein
MRKEAQLMRSVLTFLILLSCCASPVFGLDFATDVDFLNLSMWDHSSTKAGQLFEDVWNDVDVTVQATGDFQLPAYVKHQELLISPNEVPGIQNFHFTFDAPVPVVIQHWSTDEYEKTSVLANEITNYTHQFGRPGTLTPIEGGYELQGAWHGIGPDGAAKGYFETAPVTEFTLSHTALIPFKFEAYRIGIITAPEPSSAALLLICVGGVVFLRRRGGS